MTSGPRPEEIVDITGPEGETLFWHLKGWLVARREHQIQARLDEMWAHYKEIADDRLLVVVAALCVEESVNALLQAIAPHFDQCLEDTDFTFSLRIRVARTLRLIPSRILTNCDLVRQIRNEFAHHLDVRAFGQLDPKKHLQKLLPYVAAFSTAPRDASNHSQLFRDLVGFTLAALEAYTQQVTLLRKYLDTVGFREAFKDWAEKNC